MQLTRFTIVHPPSVTDRLSCRARPAGIARRPEYSHGARLRPAEHRPLCEQARGSEYWYALPLEVVDYEGRKRALVLHHVVGWVTD